MKGSKPEIQEEVAKAILSGELFVEEAMVKYNIKSKRTIASWVKKYMSSGGEVDPVTRLSRDRKASGHSVLPPYLENKYGGIVALWRKINELQTKIEKLECKDG